MLKTIGGFAAVMGLLIVGWSGNSGVQARAAGAQSQAAAAPAAAQTATLPKVFIFATGGTISNRVGGRLTVDELIASLPNLSRYVRAEGEQFANTSSSAMTLAQWLDLSRRINARFKSDPELAGVVVTSGTDTLEELAYFLHLTVRDERPVVVVGSMRNPSTLGYEGAANLEDAFRAAGDPMSRGMGTVVVLNDEINSAREVTKTDSFNLNTFQSRAFGILGVVDPSGVAYYRKPTRRHSAQSEFNVDAITELPRVDVVVTYQGATGDVVKVLVDAGAKGIIMATAGAGALAGNQGEGTRYATEKGVWTVTTTRAGTGRIPAPGPGRGGTNFRLAGDNLTPIKARVLLMLAIATTTDGAQIQRMFREY